MGINGISAAGYPITGYRKARQARKSGTETAFAESLNNTAAAPQSYTVYMKTDDMLYSGGNGTGLSFYIKYAENTTDEDPTVVAKGVDENGKKFEQTIHINDINPQHASVVEMHALESYLNVDKNGGLSSLPMDTGMMGLHDRADFMGLFEKQIRDMTLLKQQRTAAYYRQSMQAFWAFMDRK
ncbi:MAG: hypothetical protein K2N95_04140 [Lachnospiraceae bacterium]|nr:hypothetical protein [Lachnospiraceae bacterium]